MFQGNGSDAVFSGIYIAVVQSRVRITRAREFVNAWLPRYREFMDEVTPPLEEPNGDVIIVVGSCHVRS